MKKPILILLMACVPLVFGYGLSMAADPMAGVPVIDRNFKKFEPKGVRVGKFMVLPNLTTAVEYTDNVLQTNAQKDSDRVAIISPEFKAEGDFGPHVVSFEGRADQFLYDEYDSQDRLNYDVQGAINLSLSSVARFDAKIVAQQNHNRRLEEAGSIIDASEPVQYNRIGFLTDLILKPSKYEWRIGTAISQLTYQNTRRISDNSLIVQNDRDRMSYGGSVNVTYDAGLRFKPAFGVSYTWFDFDRRDFIDGSGFTGVVQDRQRFAMLGGIELVPTGKWRGQAKVGLGYEVAKDDVLDNQITNLVEIDLTYLYTPLTNFNFEFERFFDDDTNATRGSIQTRLAASVVHELTRQWMLSAGLSYEWRDFQNDSNDTTLSGFVGADYKINRKFTLGGAIEYIDRESNRRNGDFDETKAMIRLKSAF
jgi:hypothetical protein